MPSKWRLRGRRGASMAKGGMRPVSTSETASPKHWPSPQGRNSWQKERIFGLPTRNWFRDWRLSAGGGACLTDECVRPCVCVYSSSSFTSPRSAFAFSIILSCSCCGTVS
jgi:hypothetical protein